jgi:hypothetical protein
MFNLNKIYYAVNAYYPLRHLQEGQNVNIIYEASDPAAAAIYSWWGYWFKWDELLASVLIPLVLLFAAKEITSKPTPEALIEELEMRNKTKLKKYD